MPTSSQAKLTREVFAEAVDVLRDAGVKIDPQQDRNTLLPLYTALQDASYRRGITGTAKARSFDSHHNQSPRGEADLYVAEDGEEPDDGELDPARLRQLLSEIEDGLKRGGLNGAETKMFVRLGERIRSYLNAGRDSDTMRGRSTRDMLRNGNDPLRLIEDGAGPLLRRHLRRNRQLAARAKDAKPAPGRSFLGRRPEPGSDLDVLDRMAARTFNL